MRYLIAETSWPMMNLATQIASTGTLLTRTDRPEDIPHYMQLGTTDMLLIEDTDLGPHGLDLRELLKANPQTPIVVLTQEATGPEVAKLLLAGADAVLPLHMSSEEIAMRLRAVACRSLGLALPTVELGPVSVCLNNRRAYMYDCPLKLGPKLYELLEYLCLRPNRLITRSDLLTHMYGLEQEPDPRVFDVYICNLRACLKAAEAHVEIETVRGAGFRLVVPALFETAA
jgi:DNA-binding response OmpR family regulator